MKAFDFNADLRDVYQRLGAKHMNTVDTEEEPVQEEAHEESETETVP